VEMSRRALENGSETERGDRAQRWDEEDEKEKKGVHEGAERARSLKNSRGRRGALWKPRRSSP